MLKASMYLDSNERCDGSVTLLVGKWQCSIPCVTFTAQAEIDSMQSDASLSTAAAE